jgi:hypothetical protein
MPRRARSRRASNRYFQYPDYLHPWNFDEVYIALNAWVVWQNAHPRYAGSAPDYASLQVSELTDRMKLRKQGKLPPLKPCPLGPIPEVVYPDRRLEWREPWRLFWPDWDYGDENQNRKDPQ